MLSTYDYLDVKKQTNHWISYVNWFEETNGLKEPIRENESDFPIITFKP